MKKNLPLYLSIAVILLFCVLVLSYVLYMNFSASENEGAASDSSGTSVTAVSQEEASQTLNGFVDALKVYDIEKMTPYLSSFPNKTRDGTIDDMYNDEVYQTIYRHLYSSITYEIKEYKNNYATVSVTMPNIKQLYQNATLKLNLGAMNNEELKDKIMENDTNAIVLFQQLMLYEVTENNSAQQMTRQYYLTFDRSGEKVKIITDDQLCAFMTGDFSTTRELPNDITE